MTSRQIQCFMVAAQKLNFTTASEILFLSQSNMSRNISQLEEELDMQLFERQKNRVILTPAGVIMYETFSQMEKYLRHRIDLARCGGIETKGHLIIGFICYMDLDSFFTERLHLFTEKHPEIDVELIALPTKSFEHILETGEADIIITQDFNAPKSTTILSAPLAISPVYIMYSKKHPLANKENLSLYDFSNETFWISDNVNSPALIHLLHRICAHYKLENYEIKSTASYNTSLINTSLGKGVLPVDAITTPDLPNGFNIFRLDEKEFYVNILMNWSKSNFNPAITSFVRENIYDDTQETASSKK